MTFASDPMAVWRHEVGRKLLSLDFEPAGHQPFAMQLDVPFNGDGVRLARFRHSAGFTTRDRNLIAKAPDDCWTLIVAGSSGLIAGQRSQEMRLRPGEACLVHNNEPGHVGGRSRQVSFSSLIVPQAALKDVGLNAEDHFGRPLAGNGSALRLLRSYLKSLDRLTTPMPGFVTDAVRRHLLDLGAMALREAHGMPVGESHDDAREARLVAALNEIDQHLPDADLTVPLIAQRLGISPRYLHTILERAGVRFNEHITNLRLDIVAKRLADPDARDIPISNVALEAGFGDVSHFNRVFRSRYDTTPSEFRKRALRGGGRA